MPNLKVPSLQHLARQWRRDPDHISRLLVNLVEHGPTFSYDPLYGAVHDMLVFKQPYEQIVEGMRRHILRPSVRDNFLGVLPLIRDHFAGVSPTFVQDVASRYYPVGRDLKVPFRPPFVYGADGRLHLPWFIFWRRNPLGSEQLSLFVTIVDEILSQDPDLDQADFVILDFSVPDGDENKDRVLDVMAAREIPRLSDERKTEMLDIFAKGFLLAQARLAGRVDGEKKHGSDRPEDRPDPDQPGLFDPK